MRKLTPLFLALAGLSGAASVGLPVGDAPPPLAVTGASAPLRGRAPPGLRLAAPALRVGGRVPISVDLQGPATVRIALRRGGRHLRTMSSGLALPAGVTAVPWDGRLLVRGRWVPAPEGEYRAAVWARDAGGRVAARSVRLSVDGRAPQISRWRVSPDPVKPGRTPVRLRFRVWDAAPPLMVGFEIFDADGRPIGEIPAREMRRGTRSVLFRPASRLARGSYSVFASVFDSVGNRARFRAGGFRVHQAGKSRVYERLPKAGRRVALTIDDCYGGRAWRRILQVLKAHETKAAFFCTAEAIRAFPHLAARTVRDGHTIGSHTADHSLLTRLPYSRISRKITADRRLWWKLARATSGPWFRPPYGAYDSRVLRAAGRTGYTRTIMWDVDPRDWRNPGVARVRSRVVRGARAGSIILLHTEDDTARALPGILRGLRDRRLEPVSLAELFRVAAARR